MTDSTTAADSIETLQLLSTTGKLVSVARFFHPDSKNNHSVASLGQVRDPLSQTWFQVVKIADLNNALKSDFYLFTVADLRKLTAALEGNAPVEHARKTAEIEFGPPSQVANELEAFQRNETILAAEEFAARRKGAFTNALKQLEAVVAGGKPQISTYPSSLAIDRLLWDKERASVFTGEESQKIGQRQAVVKKIHDLLETVEGEVAVRRITPDAPTLSVHMEIPRPVKEIETFMRNTLAKQVKVPSGMELTWVSTWKQAAVVLPSPQPRARRTRKVAAAKTTMPKASPKKPSGGGGGTPGSASSSPGSAVVAASVAPAVSALRPIAKAPPPRMQKIGNEWIN